MGFIGMLLLFPGYAQQLPPTVLPNGNWTTETAQAALHSLGWSAHTYMLWRMGLVLVTAVFYCGLGLFVLLRRPDDPFALLLALSMVFFGAWATDAPQVLAQWGAGGERLAYGLSTLAYGLLIFLTVLFPDGRFVPRWTRWIGILGTAVMVYAVFGVPHPTRPPAAPIVALTSLLFLAGAAGQVFRYRVVGTAVQRQQTKWVLGAILLNLAFQLGLNIIYANPVVNALDGQGMLFSLLRTTMLTLVTVTVPLALSAAILRYRLWDIGVILRKTLVYTLLSALLALVYFGSVVLLQNVIGRTADEQPPLVIVLSTLVIAALFTPLRQRVQGFIDRRFFR
ncbi:MAG: hypothetical protein KC415_09850, partial [Anaerolineales bacterium]|nr:hypothetical protein [Anaerolineales bacterium]